MKILSTENAALLAALCAFAFGAAAGELDDIVRERIAASDTPACIAVGRVGDTTEEAFACSSGAAPVPSRDTIFEIGSITKGFTGLLLADMVRKGEVSLDDPASKYSRAGAKLPTFGSRQITLRDLVTQTSSLPRLPPGFTPSDARNPYANFDADALYAALARTTLARPIGQRPEYSNFGFMWLSEMLARRAAKPYEALLSERVLDPLGMRDTAITLSEGQRGRAATPHAAGYQPTPPWDVPGDLGGVGALRSSLEDMLKLAAALAGRSDTPLKESIALALEAMRPAEMPGNSTGYAWVTLERPGVRVYWHNGGTGGSHAMIAVNPRMRSAAVVLVDSTASFDDLGFHLVEPSLPLNSAHVALPIDASTRAQYAGTYQVAPNFRIEVFVEGERLMTRATGQRAIEIARDGPDTFFLRGVEARLLFHRVEAGGAIDSVTIQQGGRETPAARLPVTRAP